MQLEPNSAAVRRCAPLVKYSRVSTVNTCVAGTTCSLPRGPIHSLRRGPAQQRRPPPSSGGRRGAGRVYYPSARRPSARPQAAEFTVPLIARREVDGDDRVGASATARR